MSEKLQVTNVSTEKSASTRDPSALLQDVVARIRCDCAENSRQYVDETKVPHGGE